MNVATTTGAGSFGLELVAELTGSDRVRQNSELFGTGAVLAVLALSDELAAVCGIGIPMTWIVILPFVLMPRKASCNEVAEVFRAPDDKYPLVFRDRADQSLVLFELLLTTLADAYTGQRGWKANGIDVNKQ